MKRLIAVCLAVVLVLGLGGVAVVANSDSHTVTVQVNAINELAIEGGNFTLTINSATAGSQPDPATDSTTCDVLWTTNEASKKITVATSVASPPPNFTLKVVAQNVNGGTAASEVTLSDTAQDFVTAVGTTIGNCDLAYTASATAAQGTGSDIHTVTYTITAA